ncbi:MAG: hypothetical protein A2583_11280 [Bdellovibrionales bacterium RIFOXYD1_FULL_53_11]|nr:MAG: hypothetical protein A2583_11280 [Bdellovibrionales bacterium RIFOXYD1_FULL_53_11]
MNNEAITALIYDNQNTLLKQRGITRNQEKEIYSTLGSKPIKIITGFRRTGKSFLAKQIAAKCTLEKGILPDNILYMNFEDYRLTEVLNAKQLGDVYDVFIAKIARKGRKILIFDEIQNIENWEKFIRTIYEKHDNTEIIITGSNSELLSSELGSRLSGRFIEFFILPFSFHEMLIYRGITINETNDWLKNKTEIEKYFFEYVKFGGLPEIFEISSDDAKTSYLSGILNKVILDDIVKRFAVANIDLLERTINYTLACSGNIVSFNRIGNHIKNMGIKAKPETIINYMNYFKKVFSIFELDRFDNKKNRFFSTLKKFFAVDTGLITLTGEINNAGFRLENIVFLELLRQKKHCGYEAAASGGEIDFIYRTNADNHQKIQVCQALTEENKKRELGNFGLLKTNTDDKNLLLSLDNEETPITYNKETIERKNIIKWLLGI